MSQDNHSSTRTMLYLLLMSPVAVAAIVGVVVAMDDLMSAIPFLAIAVILGTLNVFLIRYFLKKMAGTDEKDGTDEEA